jgi:hypothetical protein
MTAAAVATLTSGTRSAMRGTAAVLAIAVGAVCVLGWLARVGFLADGLWVCDHLRAAGLATRPGSHDVRRRNRAGRVPCRVRTATHSRSRTGRDRPRRMVAARGEALLGAGIAARMLQRFGRAAIGLVPSSPSVRPRSWGCWPGGRDNAGVARRLGVSPETVHNHASNIITMLHVSDRSGAIFRARDAGLGGPLGRAELPLPLVSRSSSAIIDDHRR